MKMKKTAAVLAMLAALGLADTAQATQYQFSYFNADDSIMADGTITTSGGLVANVGGSGYSGFEITDITGERNGQAIGAFIPNASFPGYVVIQNAQIDQGLVGSPPGLDNNGLIFTTSAGTFNLYSLDGNPNGGDYAEFTVGSDPNIINDVTFSIKDAPSVASVPDGGSTATLLLGSLGCFGGLAFLSKRTNGCFGLKMA